MNMNLARKLRTKRSGESKLDRQRGDMLVNIGIALAIITVLAVVGMPAIKGWIIEGRAPAVAGEVQRLMARLRVMGDTGVAQPFANVDNQTNLIPALRGSTVVRVDESANTVAHNLGGRGSGTNGTIVLAPAAFDAYGLGTAYQLTFTNVHDKACPTLASMLSSASETITINGNIVKQNLESAADTSYNSVDAQQHCQNGENNDFVFVAR